MIDHEISLDGFAIHALGVTIVEPHSKPGEPSFQRGVDRVVVVVSQDINDRDTGAPRNTVTRITIDAVEWGQTDHYGRQYLVRSAVLRAVAHEVLEHMKFDGVRAFDPHKGE